MTPEEELEQLNQQYVKASLAGDVEWYRRRLAEEFVCIESDGSVLDKAAFLRQTAQDGIPGVSRYVDVYARSGDEWKAVSAQITRPKRFGR